MPDELWLTAEECARLRHDHAALEWLLDFRLAELRAELVALQRPD